MNKKKVVIGTWPLSGDFGPVGLRTICDVLEACARHGFFEFDVAPNYGNGFMESCLGSVFGDDQRILINTKCGNPPFGEKNFDTNALGASLEQSLKRLRRDKVHVLFLHNPRGEVGDLGPAVQFLEEQKKNGNIELGGLSAAKGYSYDHTILEQMDALQDDVNILYLESIRSRPVPRSCFYARSPLATGILSGRMSRGTVFDTTDYRAGWLKGERLDSLMARVDELKKLTRIPIPSLAHRFVLQLPRVDKVIFGIKKTDHLSDLESILSSPDLPEDLIQSIFGLYDQDFGRVDERHLGY
jgi:aryl-alcohol dehydrogenase-like predicted oxidoreductase